MPSVSDFLESEAGAALRGYFREQNYAKGALLREDDRDQIFIVKRGRLRIYLASVERELSLAYLVEGDIFSTHSRAQMRAEQSTQLLFARRVEIERQLSQYPLLQAAVIRVLAMTLTQSITLIEDLAFHQVRGRLARYLQRCAQRQKVVVTAGTHISLELSMEEIASMIGTTRQTASTEFNAMLHEGVITRVDRRHIAVAEPERLQAWANEG